MGLRDNLWALHWDCKLLKPLKHVDEREERVAILLKSGKKEFLLRIVKVEGKSTADNESNCIMSVLNSYTINYDHIVALVFDTTSLNTGTRTGIVRQLEQKMGKKFLQLACRHHVLELIACACCSEVYGKNTTCPTEPTFEVLKKQWRNINKDDIKNCQDQFQFLNREIKTRITSVVVYLQNWLKCNSATCLRDDYKQLVVLTLLFLNGSIPLEKYSIGAPGACHHARWMARILYSLKIALFQHQLEPFLDTTLLNKISSLAFFYVFFMLDLG